MRSYIATSVGTIAVPLIGNISGPELHFTYFITLIFLPSSYVMLFSFIILYQLSVHLFLTHAILHRILFPAVISALTHVYLCHDLYNVSFVWPSSTPLYPTLLVDKMSQKALNPAISSTSAPRFELQLLFPCLGVVLPWYS